MLLLCETSHMLLELIFFFKNFLVHQCDIISPSDTGVHLHRIKPCYQFRALPIIKIGRWRDLLIFIIPIPRMFVPDLFRWLLSLKIIHVEGHVMKRGFFDLSLWLAVSTAVANSTFDDQYMYKSTGLPLYFSTMPWWQVILSTIRLFLQQPVQTYYKIASMLHITAPCGGNL